MALVLAVAVAVEARVEVGRGVSPPLEVGTVVSSEPVSPLVGALLALKARTGMAVYMKAILVWLQVEQTHMLIYQQGELVKVPDVDGNAEVDTVVEIRHQINQESVVDMVSDMVLSPLATSQAFEVRQALEVEI
jgi:hypothetical protein